MGFEGGEEGAKARGEMEVWGVKLVGGGGGMAGGDATHFSKARLWVVVARYEALDALGSERCEYLQSEKRLQSDCLDEQ